MKWLRDIAIFGAGCCFGAAGLIVVLMVGFVVRDQLLSARPLFATTTPALSSSEPLMVPHPSKTMEVVPTEPVPLIVSTEPQSTLAILPTTIVLQTIEPTPTPSNTPILIQPEKQTPAMLPVSTWPPMQTATATWTPIQAFTPTLIATSTPAATEIATVGQWLEATTEQRLATALLWAQRLANQGMTTKDPALFAVELYACVDTAIADSSDLFGSSYSILDVAALCTVTMQTITVTATPAPTALSFVYECISDTYNCPNFDTPSASLKRFANAFAYSASLLS